jgi:hypothetical protein
LFLQQPLTFGPLEAFKFFAKRTMGNLQNVAPLATQVRVCRNFKEEFMGLRIRTNVSSLLAQRHTQNNANEMERSLERLSSGYRINRSADDAAG